MIFDGSRTASANVLVDFVSPQAIGQIRFINGVSVVLTVLPDETLTPSSNPLPPPARLLNIGSNLLGSDFEITAGCSVQVKSPDGKRTIAGLVFQLEPTIQRVSRERLFLVAIVPFQIPMIHTR